MSSQASHPVVGQVDAIRASRTAAENEMDTTYPIFRELERRIDLNFSGGPARSQALNDLQRTLISVGQAILFGKDSSIEFTITRAISLGATKEMIEEVIDISLINGGGLAISAARFAHEVLVHS
jgi:alkylhydroperoxidase/carboxymuconolactone decarboxylase family protein YurZ